MDTWDLILVGLVFVLIFGVVMFAVSVQEAPELEEEGERPWECD